MVVPMTMREDSIIDNDDSNNNDNNDSDNGKPTLSMWQIEDGIVNTNDNKRQ